MSFWFPLGVALSPYINSKFLFIPLNLRVAIDARKILSKNIFDNL